MRSFLTCLFPRLACVVAVSCAPGSQRVALAPKGVRVDTVLAFTANPFSTKYFPQIPDSSRPPASVQYYLLASSDLNAGLPIQVLGFANDSIVQAQFMAALRSIEVSRK